jgi:restriction system protein
MAQPGGGKIEGRLPIRERAEAAEFARHLRERGILIDGRRLAELMIEHGVGVRLNRAIEFKKLDEDYFDEED